MLSFRFLYRACRSKIELKLHDSEAAWRGTVGDADPEYIDTLSSLVADPEGPGDRSTIRYQLMMTTVIPGIGSSLQ